MLSATATQEAWDAARACRPNTWTHIAWDTKDSDWPFCCLNDWIEPEWWTIFVRETLLVAMDRAWGMKVLQNGKQIGFLLHRIQQIQNSYVIQHLLQWVLSLEDSTPLCCHRNQKGWSSIALPLVDTLGTFHLMKKCSNILFFSLLLLEAFRFSRWRKLLFLSVISKPFLVTTLAR